MTNIAASKYKRSRQLGVNLWGNGKDPFLKKNYPPGQHGVKQATQKRNTVHGTQLQAKQKLRWYHNITEKQFKSIYELARKSKGNTGENLIGLLEKRLDTVVYRLNFAPTIFAAQQLVSHKHILVNGRKVNIKSYRVKEGDIIELGPKAKEMAVCLEAVQKQERAIPSYLTLDEKAMKAVFNRIPKLDEVPYPVQMEPQLIIEFYSK